MSNIKKIEPADFTFKLEEWHDRNEPYRIITGKDGRKWAVGTPKTVSEMYQEISRLRALPEANGEIVQDQIRLWQNELGRTLR